MALKQSLLNFAKRRSQAEACERTVVLYTQHHVALGRFDDKVIALHLIVEFAHIAKEAAHVSFAVLELKRHDLLLVGVRPGQRTGAASHGQKTESGNPNESEASDKGAWADS